MLTRRVVPLTLASLLAGWGGTARASAAVWVSHEIPPYLWLGSRGPEGYAFQLFQRVTQEAGLPVALQFYPFARAYRMLQVGQAQAALVVTRSPDREAQFQWLFPVGRFRLAVFTRQALGPIAVDIASLKARRVGSLRASVSRSMLEAAGAPHVVEGKDYAELLALLHRGIVEAVIAPESVLRTLDTRDGVGALRVALMDEAHDLYAAAGPAVSEDVVQRIRSAYQHLVDSGVVAQLRKSHPDLSYPD